MNCQKTTTLLAALALTASTLTGCGALLFSKDAPRLIPTYDTPLFQPWADDLIAQYHEDSSKINLQQWNANPNTSQAFIGIAASEAYQPVRMMSDGGAVGLAAAGLMLAAINDSMTWKVPWQYPFRISSLCSADPSRCKLFLEPLDLYYQCTLYDPKDESSKAHAADACTRLGGLMAYKRVISDLDNTPKPNYWLRMYTNPKFEKVMESNRHYAISDAATAWKYGCGLGNQLACKMYVTLGQEKLPTKMPDELKSFLVATDSMSNDATIWENAVNRGGEYITKAPFSYQRSTTDRTFDFIFMVDRAPLMYEFVEFTGMRQYLLKHYPGKFNWKSPADFSKEDLALYNKARAELSAALPGYIPEEAPPEKEIGWEY